MRRIRSRILLLIASLIVTASLFPCLVWADPSGTSTSNCWGNGGQLEVSLSGCSGYGEITVTAEFTGSISSASGWGFDTYTIEGNKVIATVSGTGPNSWAFNSNVGIQVTGSDITSASLISVTGSGSSSNNNNNNNNTNNQTQETQSGPVPDALEVTGVQGDDWLTTNGNQIVDMNGKVVWLTGCNWFGYNTGTNIFDGVWNCNLEDALKGIADRGFNVLRVPFSAELLLQWKNGNFPQANYNNAYNESLNSMNSLEIFDYVLRLCEMNGIKVIIDIHTVKTDASGHNYPLWYREDMSEEDFIEALVWLADRYKDNDTIIGLDLKNEPHGKASETDHAIWNDSDSDNNWKAAAERAGNAVLDVNPHLLIIIEGIQIYPIDPVANDFQSSNDEDYYNTWWGANLMGVRDYPIDFGSAERNAQIVYSPHDYGPRVFMQPWFEGGFTYESLMEDAWSDYWLYINDEGIAPIFVGEWGGFMEGDNLTWMEYFRDLIMDRHLHHTFWCYNANSGDTGGLVKDDFVTWDEDKYALVKPVLWQTEDGQFIGLDHEIPLGANGISLSQYTGEKVNPVLPYESQTEQTALSAETTEYVQQTETQAPEAVPAQDKPSGKTAVVAAVLGVLGLGFVSGIVIVGIKLYNLKKKES